MGVSGARIPNELSQGENIDREENQGRAVGPSTWRLGRRRGSAKKTEAEQKEKTQRMWCHESQEGRLYKKERVINYVKCY